MENTIENKKVEKQFFNNTELILYSAESPNIGFMVKGYNNPHEKYYLYRGQFYGYEFCGNGNWIIRGDNRIRTPRFKKDEYCKILTIMHKFN